MKLRKIGALIIALSIVMSGFTFAYADENGNPTITDVALVRNHNCSSNMSDTITINNAWGKKVLVQQFSKSQGKWITRRTLTTDNVRRDRINIVYPSNWKKTTYSSWRFQVAKTETTSAATSKTIKVVARNRSYVKSSCKSAVVLNSKGQVLYSKSMDRQLHNASTTKLMTAILVIQNLSLDSKVKISRKAARTPWGNLNMKTGDSYKVKSLFNAMLISSSNDSATALAEKVSGTTSKFATLMNAKAKAIGCKNTHFVNPHGLDNKYHYSSAYDLALMIKYAYKYKIFRSVTAKKSYAVYNARGNFNRRVYTTNSLLGKYAGVVSGKTGTEDLAGYCFVSVYKYDGRTYYIAVLGSSTHNNRWRDSKAYYSYIRKYGV